MPDPVEFKLRRIRWKPYKSRTKTFKGNNTLLDTPIGLRKSRRYLAIPRPSLPLSPKDLMKRLFLLLGADFSTKPALISSCPTLSFEEKTSLFDCIKEKRLSPKWFLSRYRVDKNRFKHLLDCLEKWKEEGK